jgi:protease-4
MGKFLLGVLTGLVLVFLAVVLAIVAAVRMHGQPPDVAAGSVLVLRLEGELPEKPAVELPFLDNGRGAVTVTSVWVALRQAAADQRIKAVVLEPDGLQAGWGKIEEIRGDLATFRKSGKPVYAYLRNPGGREYYVALAADRVYLGPEDPLMLKGLRAEILYFKNTLDKLGVTVQVEHAGKYKDFGDMFTRSDMSPETREVIGSVIDGLFDGLVSRIGEARHKTPEQVRALIDSGPFTAKQARQNGLVDSLGFEDQMWSELKDKLHDGEPARVPIEKYIKVPAESAGLRAGSRIALVAGEGDIVRGNPDDEGEDGELGSYGFDKLLRDAGADSSIKGVIVRIDSPGGEVTASDDIWHEMKLLSQKKPLVISMSDVAASGGYYMALTGDPIVAYPGTETGSIGVVFGKPDLRGLYEKLGVTKDAIERGRNAGIDSDYTSLTPEQQDLLKAGIDDSYHDFVQKVAEARHKGYEDVEPLAQGRVWLGSQAQPRGLVDAVGGLDTALALLKKKAKIPDAENVSITVYPARRSLLDLLIKRSGEESLVTTQLRRVFGRVPYHAWMRGGMLRLMPIWLEVR